MNETVSTVGADLKMMLQLMMEVPLVIAALAARVVVLHVRVAQGRAVTLMIRMWAGDRDRRRKLVHAGGLLMVHHLLLLLLLLLNGARGWLLLRLLSGLPLRLVAAFTAGVSQTPAVSLVLPLSTETVKRRLLFEKRQLIFFSFFFEDLYFA